MEDVVDMAAMVTTSFFFWAFVAPLRRRHAPSAMVML
jgi:hypothetical protein